MNHTASPPTDRAGFLVSAAVVQSVGTLYLLISGMVAAEMSSALSVALLALSACSAAGTVFLFRRHRWAWFLSTALSALFIAGGLVVTLLDGLAAVGLIHAAAGACVLGLLWTGRTALPSGWSQGAAAESPSHER
jgi:hypothetical protein